MFICRLIYMLESEFLPTSEHVAGEESKQSRANNNKL